MSSDFFPNSWKLCPLEDVMDAIIDYRGKTPKKTESGVPLVTAKIVKDGYVQTPTEFIAEDSYETWMVRGLPEVGDVVLTTEAPLGEAAQLTDSNVALAQRIVTLRGKKGALSNDYLLCAMQSNYVQHQLEARATGSTVKGIKQSELRKVILPVPPFEEQQRISNILKSISDKILLNSKTNQTLEQIAQAIFKSWFVDFDPVKAKIETLAAGGSADDAELAAMRVISAKTLDELNSLKANNPEAFNKLAQTAALFSAAMQDSELGEVPEGWEVKQLKDILELAYGKALKKTDRVDGDVPVYGSGGLTGYHNQSLVEGPGIIVGRKGTVGSVYWEPKAFYPIDTVFYVKPRAGYSLKYCHLVLQNLGLKDMNTDAAVPGLNRDNAYRLDVITPTKGVMNLFKEIMQSLQSNVDANNAQSASLESLRDTLLPKLLSGEIDLTSEVTA
ncbi:restriction endonuclease subunit S [Vibrio vulnificus]|nr:restriction endonuclease subunit S [Vibrio vulnificus]EHZ2719854.1 restriction endonuclease subunit S [Vibrio vulnificus]EKA7336710.1 restriction endonuclease subunit S [Vibrio vulnificus]EME0066368.1 restriction endonuclease subunit S [Vibrio vulnificus]